MTPVEPPKKTIGRNTAESTSAMATSAIWICSIDATVASRGRHLRILVHQALDVLDHDDCVVDEQAGRQHQPEQGHGVDGKAERVEDREGAEQHDRHGDERDQRRPPALQEHEHDQHDEQDRLEQRLHDLPDRQLDEVAGVVGVGVVVAGRHARRDFGDLGLDQIRGSQRVGARFERDADAGARVAVGADRRGIIVGAQLDPRDIAEQNARSGWIGLDDDVAELVGGLQPRLRRHRRVELLALGCGRPPISPAAISVFWFWSAVITSLGISPKLDSLCGSSQIRIA